MWLLFCDQFEQIFTRCAKESRRAEFMRGLAQLAERAPQDIKLVLAMRSDFFDRFGPHPEFGRLAQTNILLVPDMLPSELRAAIEQPAARHGVAFEEGLVEEIIADIKGRAGALPLLQYTLNELWRADNPSEDRTLHAKSYHVLGGIEGALSKRADALYLFARASEKVERRERDREAIRRLFLRVVDLTGQGATAVAVSRRAPLDEIRDADEQKLLVELVDAMLLVANAAPSATKELPGQAATVELSHESLLSAWPRLRDWINEARDVVYVRNRMSADCRAYRTLQEKGAAQEELWSGTRLAHALELRSRGDFDTVLGGLSKEEQEFLEASRELRDARARARALTQRIVLGSSIGALLTMILALTYGLYAQSAKAAAEQRAAKLQEDRARDAEAARKEIHGQLQRAYTEQGRTLLVEQKNPIRALSTLAGVYRENNNIASVPYLLHSALQIAEQTRLVYASNKRNIQAEMSPDGTNIIFASSTGQRPLICKIRTDSCTGLGDPSEFGTVDTVHYTQDGRHILIFSPFEIQVVETSAQRTIRTISRSSAAGIFVDAALSPDGEQLATATHPAGLTLWSVRSGEQKPLLPATGDHAVHDAMYSPNGKQLVVRTFENSLIFFDTQSGAELRRLDGNIFKEHLLRFSHDSKLFVAFDNKNYRPMLWDFETKLPPIPFNEFRGSLLDVNFSADSELLIMGSNDGTARIFRSDGQLKQVLAHPTSVVVVGFSPDGKQAVTADWYDTIRIWDVASGLLAAEYRGYQNSIMAAAFDRSGKSIFSVSQDGSVRILDMTADLKLLQDSEDRSIDQISYSPDGRSVAAIHEPKSGGLRKLSLWNAASGKLIGQFESKTLIPEVAYAPDGRFVIAADDDKSLKLMDSQSGKLANPIPVDGLPHGLRFSQSADRMLFQLGQGPTLFFDANTIKHITDQQAYREIARTHEEGLKMSSHPFRPNGQQIVAFGGKLVAVFSTSTGKLEKEPLKGHSHAVDAAIYSPDGKRILSYGFREAIAWDAETQQRIRDFSVGVDRIHEVTFSRDSAKLFVEYDKGQIEVLDALHGQPLFELPGLHAPGIEVSPDGLRVATITQDGDAVKLWETEQGRLLATLIPPGFAVSALSFSPDGQHLLVAGTGAAIFDVGAEKRPPAVVERLLGCVSPSQGKATSSEVPLAVERSCSH